MSHFMVNVHQIRSLAYVRLSVRWTVTLTTLFAQRWRPERHSSGANRRNHVVPHDAAQFSPSSDGLLSAVDVLQMWSHRTSHRNPRRSDSVGFAYIPILSRLSLCPIREVVIRLQIVYLDWIYLSGLLNWRTPAGVNWSVSSTLPDLVRLCRLRKCCILPIGERNVSCATNSAKIK